MNRHSRAAGHGWRFRVLIGLALSAGAIMGAALMTHEASAKSRSGSEGINTREIEKKLDEILGNQQTILDQFEDLKEDLRIIKVRASR